MTRRSQRELERSLDDLDGGDDAPDDGFLSIRIGGDPDADAGGYYTWSSERGAYVNDEGHELPADTDGGTVFDR